MLPVRYLHLFPFPKCFYVILQEQVPEEGCPRAVMFTFSGGYLGFYAAPAALTAQQLTAAGTNAQQSISNTFNFTQILQV